MRMSTPTANQTVASNLLGRSIRMGQEQLNSWRILSAYTLSVGGAWLAKIRLDDSRRRRLARRDQARLPCARTWTMGPAPGRPPTQPRNHHAAPFPVVCFQRGLLLLVLALRCAFTRLRMTLCGALQGGFDASRRAHIAKLCCLFFPTRTPEAKRLSHSWAALWHPRSDNRGAALQPCRPLLQRRCARGSGRHAMSSRAPRAHAVPVRGHTSRFLCVTRWTFGVRGSYACRPCPVALSAGSGPVTCRFLCRNRWRARVPGTRSRGDWLAGRGGGMRASTAHDHSLLCGV